MSPKFPLTKVEKAVFLKTAAMFAVIHGLNWAAWYSESDNARASRHGVDYPVDEWIRTYAAEQIAEGICPN